MAARVYSADRLPIWPKIALCESELVSVFTNRSSSVIHHLLAPVEALVFNTTADKGPGADEDDFMVFKRKTNELSKQEQKHKGTTSTLKAAPKKIVKF
jgi:hypothetical protein